MYLLQKRSSLGGGISSGAVVGASERGYILLFTLGVLSVIAVLALSVATAVRLEARALGDEKIKLQQQYALTGAVHRGIAQLSVNASKDAKDRGQSTPDNLGKPSAISAVVFDLELNGFELHGASLDASLLPDGNLLSYDEWMRLAVVLGANDEGAQTFAKTVLQDKRAIELSTGRGGFRSIKEIVGSNTLSLPLIRGALNDQGLDLTDLIVIGTQKKQLDINESPLVMFKILANFSTSQLERLSTLRTRGVVSDAEAAQMLSGNAIPRRREASNFLRLSVENHGALGSKSLGLVALIKKEGDAFQIVDSTYIQSSLLHQ
ncbi:MAG: hypothetical protein CFE43_06955 [Burkholderiales bacterium PBB3]|nr:MAG: hypothetical protein CFE43_06955 [Burkholderiales bacterium PBB3]